MKIVKFGTRAFGYTLVEALVASSILMIGVGAAASLSMTMTIQEEVNNEVSRGLTYQEGAVRLYQMGISPEDIVDLLPEEPSIKRIEFTIDTKPDMVVPNVGELRKKIITVDINAGGAVRTHSLEAYRSVVDGDDVDTDVVRDFNSGALSGGYTAH